MKLRKWLSEFIYGKPRILQECLLRRALCEEGIDAKKCDITVNHDLGISFVNGIKLGLIYPRSYLDKVRRLAPNPKIHLYYFNGAMPASGGRKQLLEPFLHIPGTRIVESRVGRLNRLKGRFNRNYYLDMVRSRFILCPHQINWKGTKEALWTYRFAEACIAGAIPVLFKKTPLCDEFIHPFGHVWDDELPHVYDNEVTIENQRLAEAKYFINASEIAEVKKEAKALRTVRHH